MSPSYGYYLQGKTSSPNFRTTVFHLKECNSAHQNLESPRKGTLSGVSSEIADFEVEFLASGSQESYDKFILKKSFLPDFADDDEDSGADSLNDPYLMSIGGGGGGGYGMASTGYLSTASSQDGGLLRYAFHLHIQTFRRTLAEKFLESIAS